MRASVSSDEIASARISCSDRSLKFFATRVSPYQSTLPVMQISIGAGQLRQDRPPVAVPKSERRGCYHEDCGDKGQDQAINVRVDQEQASRERTEGQRDEHAPKPPSLFRRLGAINEVAHNEYERRSRCGRVRPLDMERSGRSAPHPHRDPPQTEENVRDVCGRLPANREPEDQETCMPEQRQTEGDRHSMRPHTRTAAAFPLNNPRP